MQRPAGEHTDSRDRLTMTGKQGPSAPAALLTGALMGAAGGAVIGLETGGGFGAAVGAAVGAVVYAPLELVSHAVRRPGDERSELFRIPAAAFVGAVVGSLAALVFGNSDPFLFGLVFGAALGATGFFARLALHWNRLVLGLLSGAIVGGLAEWMVGEASLALVAALTVILYRVVGAILFRRSDIVALAAEAVHSDEARFVVPFESSTGRVGTDFVKDLARAEDGSFKRNPEGIGIVESLDSLRGPTFAPEKVHPLIQEFYEHTSRFKLTIVPKWKPLMRGAYWFFKRTIAQRIGQANLPMDVHEAQANVVSHIDTIGFEGGDIVDLRAWIRAFKDSGEAIYVGIYTVVRHADAGYVSVGFPLPSLNFTVTLRPFNNGESGLLLKTHNVGSSFTGHYLTSIDELGHLTVVEVPTMSEEIDVYVEDGELYTDHRFYLSGRPFLTLFYSMERA